MNKTTHPALAALLLSLALSPATALAEPWTLEFLCADRTGTWDATTSTCTFTRDIVDLPQDQILIIRAGETLAIRDGLDYAFFRGVVFNEGTLSLYDADAIFNTLINTGTVDHQARDTSYALALGTGQRVPSVNTGLMIIGARLVIATALDNSGEILNEGIVQNVGLLDNRGSIDNRDGLVENYADGTIRNYRCPGSRGVVTAGVSNIDNQGTIDYVTGGDC